MYGPSQEPRPYVSTCVIRFQRQECLECKISLPLYFFCCWRLIYQRIHHNVSFFYFVSFPMSPRLYSYTHTRTRAYTHIYVYALYERTVSKSFIEWSFTIDSFLDFFFVARYPYTRPSHKVCLPRSHFLGHHPRRTERVPRSSSGQVDVVSVLSRNRNMFELILFLCHFVGLILWNIRPLVIILIYA